MSSPRTIIFVNQDILDQYNKQRYLIDQRYPFFELPPEGVEVSDHWSNLASLRAAARDELRQAIRLAASELIFRPDDWRYAVAV